MSDQNVYGHLVSPADLEVAVAGTLERWLDDYLGEMERHAGYQPGTIERPRGIVGSSEFENWPEDSTPVVLVLCTGLIGAPIRRANGCHEAHWLVGVAPVVSDIDQPATRKLAFSYATACRAAILQNKKLKSDAYPSGFPGVSTVTWHDEQYGELPFVKTRTLGAARIVFEIGVYDTVSDQAGPLEPYSPANGDPGNWPAVSETSVDTEPVRADELVRV